MSGSSELSATLVELGRAAGLHQVGVCSAAPFPEVRAQLESQRAEGLHGGMSFTYRNPARSTDPAATLAGARSMVVAALRYDATTGPAPASPSGRVARYATADHYRVLRDGLESVRAELRSRGHRAVVVADDNAMVDRAVAVRAGLGWYGKSSNVLLPGQGSWFVLGSVITDAELAATGAAVPDGCGTCSRCLDGCPTGAIVAPGVVDARRCLAWHLQMEGEFPREHRTALGDRIYGCDECQEVCPPTRRTNSIPVEVGAHEPGAGAAPGAWVDLLWMLDAPDEQLVERLGQWYIPRRDTRYLRRNALVALGNSVAQRAPGADTLHRLDAALAAHLDGDDELLAGHAAWAALRAGRDHLLEASHRVANPVIASEVQQWRREHAEGETVR